MFSKSSFASATRLRQSGLILKGGGGTSFSSFCQFSKYLFCVCAVLLILCGMAAAAPAQISVNQAYFNAYAAGDTGKFADMEADYILTGNVDLDGYNWKPIGTNLNKFNGTFEGKGFTISNLTINTADEGSFGLFGYVNNAEFSNISFKNFSFSFTGVTAQQTYVGALAGHISGNAEIENCSGSDITIECKFGAIGGLVGLIDEKSNINNSSVVSCDLKLTAYLNPVGGLVGSMYGDITGCSVSSAKLSSVGSAGGLVGSIEGKSNITNSSASCTVSESSSAGGLVGYIFKSSNITNSSASGDLNGSSCVGGLVGDVKELSNITNSSANCNVYTAATGGAGVGAGGLAGNMYGHIINSSAFGTVTSKGDFAGGLIGYLTGPSSSIQNSFSKCTVSAKNNAGGLAGFYFGTISQSYASGLVTASENYAGGLVGYSDITRIENSYAETVVMANDYAGGLVGCSSYNNATDTQRFLKNSYFSGTVLLTGAGTTNIGSLIGKDDVPSGYSTFSNCFYLNDGNDAQGTSVSDADMKKIATFKDAGWDIGSANNVDHTWYTIEDVTYPLFLMTAVESGIPEEPGKIDSYAGGGSGTGQAKIVDSTDKSSGLKDDAVQQQDNTQKQDDTQKQGDSQKSDNGENTGFGSDIGNSKWFYFFSGIVLSALIGSLAFFLNRRK